MFSRRSNSPTAAPAKPRDAEACRECVLRLLDQRAHSEHELTTKLKQRQFPAPVITEILADFRRLKLVDDRAFARLLIEQKQRGSLAAGRRKIIQELRKRGVPQELFPELEAEFFAGEDAQDDELTRATDLLTRKLAAQRPPRASAAKTAGKSPFELRQQEFKQAHAESAKLLRFLAARGFSSDVARQALARAMHPPE